jgi:spore germination protein KB
MLIVIVRDAAVLGPLAAFSSSPSFETIRFIHIGTAITRIEIVYALFLIFLMFFKVSIVYYASVLAIAQLCKLRSYAMLVPVVGAIFVIMSMTSFENSMQSGYWGQNLAVVYSTFFEVGLPFFTLFAVLFKKIDIQKSE